MVENVVKRVLSALFTSKFLDIIDNQHINALVKIDEVVDLLVDDSCGVLTFKLA